MNYTEAKTETLKLCIQYYLRAMRQADIYGITPALIAAENGHVDALKLCINLAPNTTRDILDLEKTGKLPAEYTIHNTCKLILLYYRLIEYVHCNQTEKAAESLKCLADLPVEPIVLINHFLQPLSSVIMGQVKQCDPIFFQFNDQQISRLLTLILRESSHMNPDFRSTLFRNIGNDMLNKSTCANTKLEKTAWQAHSLLFYSAIMHEDDQKNIEALLILQIPEQNRTESDSNHLFTTNIVCVFDVVNRLKFLLESEYRLPEQTVTWLLHKLNTKTQAILLDAYNKLFQSHQALVVDYCHLTREKQIDSSSEKRGIIMLSERESPDKLLKITQPSEEDEKEMTLQDQTKEQISIVKAKKISSFFTNRVVKQEANSPQERAQRLNPTSLTKSGRPWSHTP